MGRSERTHYCSYCLHFLDEIDDFCPHSPCGRTRPATGWAYFFEAGENIDGRFRIRRRLGAGGAGVTYRAIDLVADDPELRDVAIKILHHDRGQGILKDRLRLEGEVLRRLDHPNVVSFRELKVDGAEPYYLATGYMPGGSLDDVLRAQTKLSARSVLVVGCQIARALAAAHAIGVIHRDLKPANILVRDADEYPLTIRVADWGIARAFPEFVPRRHVTIQGGFVGTPEFASPEQLRGEPSVGPPTDVFGLGVLLHTLAGGQPIRDLVARGVVDFNKLREGASRYERVPLSLAALGETHMPLLDELLDQLIIRSPDARPDAETVAAYCEELIEAGDTTPQRPRDSSALPALTPSAAFESPREELFLPEDGGRAKPLRLGQEETPPPPAPDTVEIPDPTSSLVTPPEDEVPWPRGDESGFVAPTAVPEDAESLPAVQVLEEGAGPSEPVLLREPSPETHALRAEPSPIAERDDEPRRRRGSGLRWVAVIALLLLLACAGAASLLFGPAAVERLALLGPPDDGSAAWLDDGRISSTGRRQGAPTPPRAADGTLRYPDEEGEPEETAPPPRSTGRRAGAAVPAAGAPAVEPAATDASAPGEEVEPAETPAEGVVVDHGTDPAGGSGRVGRTGEGGSLWSTRPGAPRPWPTDYRSRRQHEVSRPSKAGRRGRGEERGERDRAGREAGKLGGRDDSAGAGETSDPTGGGGESAGASDEAPEPAAGEVEPAGKRGAIDTGTDEPPGDEPPPDEGDEDSSSGGKTG